ncbi:hypothetical protein M8006_06635 [Halomonas sp. ATCHA]|uniref:Type IV pilin n=2 Tax=Halomonas llamarensis TaxID=2945104 RepID=A0ABT0SPA9_9GAMM|nr:hypothetical protein [Halomonas llamarensis]
MEAASILERCYTNNYSYESCTEANSYLGNQSNDLYSFAGEGVGIDAEGGNYTVSATGPAGRVKEGCETIVLHSDGQRTPSECW